MEGKAKKQQKVYIAAIVFVVHLGKMTAIMSSVLTTLVTNDINTVKRVKLDTDGGYHTKTRLCPDKPPLLV